MAKKNEDKLIKDLCGNKKMSAKECGLLVDAKKFLAALADTNRLKIMALVKNKELSVTQIYEALKIPQNLASHHISQLKRNGLLVERREGTFRFYIANQKELRACNRRLAELFALK